MKNLRRRGAAFYYDHGGTPRRWEALGRDEATAARRARELNALRAAKAGTVGQMLADCLASHGPKVEPGTLANYRIYARHLTAVFGDLPPDSLTQADVLQYLEDCPRMTFRGEIGLLSLAFAGWMRARRLVFNPCFGVRCDRKGSRRTRLISDGELTAIIARADERIAVAIELAYATGLRIGDLCALRWSDLASGIRTAKTGARQAFEPSDVLDAILTRARALQAQVGSLFVLCNRGGAQWRPRHLRSRWETACRRAGVKDANWHDIRAKAATDAERESGRDAAQRMLGHRDARTTDGYLRERRANVVRPLRRKA